MNSATVAYAVHTCDNAIQQSTSGITGYSNKLIAGIDESITDSLGKGIPHGCLHRKRIWDLGPDELVEYTLPLVGSPYGWHTWDSAKLNWHWNWNAYNGGNLDWDVSASTGFPPKWSAVMPSPSDEASLIEKLYSKGNRLNADVLLNTVEANQIWPSVKALATSLPNMRRYWYNGNLRKFIKTASGSFLAWKFGVSPILSDMMAVHRSLPKLKKEVQRHGDQDASRYSVIADIACNFDRTPWQRDFATNGKLISEVTYQGLVHKSPVLRYVLVVKPKSKYHSQFFKSADYMMTKFASSPASLAWEITPWSFVVDWFVDLRGVLRQLDRVLGTEPYETTSLTKSLSYHLETNIFHKYYTSCVNQTEPLNDQRSGRAEFLHYERSVVSAGGTVPQWKPRFGKNQAGISAALIAQKLAQR